MPTALEHVIELIVQRTIKDHGGDVTAAADALRCSRVFDADETARALWCDALERYGVADAYGVLRRIVR
jgi:hypothetical protein